jgi:hypothetical protein
VSWDDGNWLPDGHFLMERCIDLVGHNA